MGSETMDVDAKTYEMELESIAVLGGHDERAWHLAWNPTQSLIASCSSDKTVRMWSYNAGNQSSTSENSSPMSFSPLPPIPTGHTKSVRALAWAPSGKTLATASFDANIGVWEREAEGEGEWECVTLLEGHETECKSVAYASTGTLLASCSRDKSVWVWEVQPDADFECLGVMMEHSQDVKCVAWHPTEELLASASYDNTIRLYLDDPSDDWFCASTLTGHASTVWSLAFHPDGEMLASGGEDGSVRIWGRVKPVKDAALSYGGSTPGEWRTMLTLSDHTRAAYSVAWSSAGLLASTGGDGAIWVYKIEVEGETTRARVLAHLPDAHGVYDVNAIDWCPRDPSVVATAGDDGELRVWRVRDPI